MHENIKAALDRADQILTDLEKEYAASLHSKDISAATKQLCHDLLEKLKSALDRTARRYFEKHVAPALDSKDAMAATVYFPVSEDQHSFESTMGRWRWKAVKGDHQDLQDFLLQLQPFHSTNNGWLSQLNNLVNEGKHIDLSPQSRVERRHVTVSRPGGGGVSWGPGVTFGSGVSVMGVPIDPRTQRVVPNNVVNEEITIWVDFTFTKYGNSALGFCRQALAETRRIVQLMSDKFNLS